MVKLEKHQMPKIAPLFSSIDETLIWSCLQGHMGNAWADDIGNPACAQVLTGDFCFYAGESQCYEAQLLVRNIPGFYVKPCILMIPQNELWGALIEKEYIDKFDKYKRFATKKEKHIFDTKKLQGYIEKLPEEFYLVSIDEWLYNASSEEEWSADFCSQFSSYSDYKQRGLGFAILHRGELVCGASSYTVYNEGIEIEIGTKHEYRRKGLAAACASKIIIECINRGLYPSWDAANKASVALAEKLGYRFDKEYTTYGINCTKVRSKNNRQREA